MEEEESGGEEGVPAWMATFADLMSLLLTFFVLMLSFANLDVKNFRMALGSVRDAFGVQFKHQGDVKGLATSPVEMSEQESTASYRIMQVKIVEDIQQIIEENQLEDQIEAVPSSVGVIVRVRDHAIFQTGSDRILEDSKPLMAVIAQICRKIDMPIWIEGHTDSDPIKTVRFPSNWELSAARAAAAMRHLIDEGGIDADRMRMGGYADTKPLSDDPSPEGQAKNRRVEFIFITPPEPLPPDSFADAGPGEAGEGSEAFDDDSAGEAPAQG